MRIGWQATVCFAIGVAVVLAYFVGAEARPFGPRGEAPRTESVTRRADEAANRGEPTTSIDLERTDVSLEVASAGARAAIRVSLPPTLRVRLLGLDEAVSWMTDVSLDVDGVDQDGGEASFHAEARPGSDGRMTFALPGWAMTRMTRGRLRAWDWGYTRLSESWDGGRDFDEELQVFVSAYTTIRGRVVDEQDRPVHAQVSAAPVSGSYCGVAKHKSTQTRVDGSWTLEVQSPSRVRIEARATRESEARVLLPATHFAQARAGTATEVPDLVLARASFVTGRVRWIDGEPVASATLGLHQGAEDAADVSDGCTDDDGRFELAARPGLVASVSLDYSSSPTWRVPRPEVRHAMPGQEVEFVLPRPVVVRARGEGDPAIRGHIEFEDPWNFAWVSHEDRSRIVVVPTREFRVRATSERRLSPWRTIGPTDAGKTIDLAMESALTEVLVHLGCEGEVLTAESTWLLPDGREERIDLRRSRTDHPFRVFLEPGAYRLAVEATRFEYESRRRGDAFLLPIECHANVVGEQSTVRLTGNLGGRLDLAAVGADGRSIVARCVITSTTCPVRVAELDARGDPDWSGVLPAGSYELRCESAGLVPLRRNVTIEQRGLARICFRF